jgi:hypothetical protein
VVGVFLVCAWISLWLARRFERWRIERKCVKLDTKSEPMTVELLSVTYAEGGFMGEGFIDGSHPVIVRSPVYLPTSASAKRLESARLGSMPISDKKFTDNVLALLTEEGLLVGSGFFLKEPAGCVLVTAFHVLKAGAMYVKSATTSLPIPTGKVTVFGRDGLMIPVSGHYPSVLGVKVLKRARKMGSVVKTMASHVPPRSAVGRVERVGNKGQSFGHSATTKAGSSGAPVVSVMMGGVIGVHVQAGARCNYALMIPDAEAIRVVSSDVFDEKEFYIEREEEIREMELDRVNEQWHLRSNEDDYDPDGGHDSDYEKDWDYEPWLDGIDESVSPRLLDTTVVGEDEYFKHLKSVSEVPEGRTKKTVLKADIGFLVEGRFPPRSGEACLDSLKAHIKALSEIQVGDDDVPVAGVAAAKAATKVGAVSSFDTVVDDEALLRALESMPKDAYPGFGLSEYGQDVQEIIQVFGPDSLVRLAKERLLLWERPEYRLVFVAMIKNELHKPSKIDQKMYRLIFRMDMLDQMILRAICQDMVQHDGVANPHFSTHLDVTTAASAQVIGAKLSKPGQMSTDVRFMDWSHRPWVYRYYRTAMEVRFANERTRRLWNLFFEKLDGFYTVLPGGRALQLKRAGVLPSGVFITTHFNTWVRTFLAYCVNPKVKKWNFMACGDNAVEPEVPFSAYSELGYLLKREEDLEFIGFKWKEERGVWRIGAPSGLSKALANWGTSEKEVRLATVQSLACIWWSDDDAWGWLEKMASYDGVELDRARYYSRYF